MSTNSIGSYTSSTQFVVLYTPKPHEFKPLIIRQVHYEDAKIKTQKPDHSADDEAQAGFAPENQQTTAR